MKHLKKILPTIFTVLLFIAGVGVLAYPKVSDWWNGRVQSRAVASYHEAVAALDEKDYSAVLKAAEEYNKTLRLLGSSEAFLHPDIIPGYEDTLDITGTGMMGTITIDKIEVDLPIYHGTGADVLAKGAGHLEGSSLPIGGKGNHSVISAHRGLPSSRLFTDLDRLDVGDVFVLHVLGNDLAYETDQIITVLPAEVDELYLDEGKDYCTLMTCTPYGINTHRLLVRGHRVYLTPEKTELSALSAAAENKDNSGRRTVKTVIMITAGVIFVLILSEIFTLLIRRYRRRSGK